MGTSQTISVVGMTCEHCVRAVGSELSELPGVTGVDVDLASGRVVIDSDAPLTPESIAAAVDEAGYEVGVVNPAAKLAGFVVALVLVFGGATAAGRALDPFGDEPVETEHGGGHSPSATTTTELQTGTTAPVDHRQDHEEDEP